MYMYMYYINDVRNIDISKADNLQHYIDVPKNTTIFTCKDCIMLGLYFDTMYMYLHIKFH